MKGTPKIFISAGGGFLALVMAALLLFFYLESTKPTKDKKKSIEVEISIGEENRPEHLRQIDQLMSTMELDKVNVQVPPKQKTNDTAQVKVSLRLAGTIELLKLSIANEALKTGSKVKINDTMAVLLSGDAFKITPRGPAEQPVFKNQNTEWKWEIRPKQAGQQELHFTVIAFFSVDGKRTSHAIKNFDKVIKIEGKPKS
ncbi:hypothetical protein [Kiloniella antarctica]|uniref:Uncharacterized protein n=1 Tax=Kiloniella antarctica TaxID=1550907 RepID=A0ABW5BHK7_9PROT